MSRECLFCGATGPGILTNEHIVTQWLLKHLGLTADVQTFQGVASSETGELTAPPRVHGSFQFVEGRVCGTCNSGWMERLESAARPVLIELIDRRRKISSLSSAESAIIGKWAAKTAYLYTYPSPLGRPVQLDHLRLLNGDNGAPHSNVGVFATQDEHIKPSGYIQSNYWPELVPPGTAANGKPPRDSYKIGLQLGYLYLLVAFWPHPSAILWPKKGLHIPILPGNSRPEVTHTLELEIGNGPVDFLAAFTNSLGVVRRDLKA